MFEFTSLIINGEVQIENIDEVNARQPYDRAVDVLPAQSNEEKSIFAGRDDVKSLRRARKTLNRENSKQPGTSVRSNGAKATDNARGRVRPGGRAAVGVGCCELSLSLSTLCFR